MCSIWSQVQQNIIWRLGNGNRTQFWKDQWVPACGPLIEGIGGQLLAHKETKKVSDFLLADGSWNNVNFCHLLPLAVCDQIKGVIHPHLDLGEDHCAWKATSNGVFTVQSAYWLITQVQYGEPAALF